MNWNKRLAYTAPFLLLALVALAQEQSRISPMAVVSAQYNGTYVKVMYSQPAKRGREIFGKLVPYGKVWRTGANEATEITLTKNMLVNGALLKAGTYSLFTIPQKDTWTVIMNKDLGLWGAYNYNPSRDEMRFDIPTTITQGEIYEMFTMQFDQKNEIIDLVMQWDRVAVTIPMKFIN